MSELYDQIVSQRGSFERLLARIPGFRGYVDRGSRRTADRLMRDYVADLLGQRLQRLTDLQNRLLDQGGLSYMSKTNSVRTKLQTYRDRVKAAAPGYSGFMEAIKVDSAELERLYNFDEAQIRYADRFTEALNTLETAIDNNEGIDAAIEAIDRLAREANEAFSMREHVLTDLDQKSS